MRAVVTDTSPLTVQVKGRTPKPVQHRYESVGTLVEGDTVTVEVIDRLLVVTGRWVAP